MKKLICALLSMAMLFTVIGCAKDDGVTGESRQEYFTDKQSETMLHFSSSDKAMDDFLNDYLHRHLRYDDYRIGELSLGNSVMFNKEWEAMSLFFFDTTSRAVPDDRVLMMENYLYNIPVDKFGYTWQAFDSQEPAANADPEQYFGQGWPFPAYPSSAGESAGWEFNDVTGTDNWLVLVDGDDITESVSEANGLLPVSFSGVESVEFLSPNTRINAFHSPFLQIDLRVSDSNGFANITDIDDVYVYWMTEGDRGYTEEKMVKMSEFATIQKEITANFSSQIYLPMFLHPEWGRSDTNVITDLRIEIRAKEGETISGNAQLNYVRGNYDTRHTNNAALLLRAAKLHYEFTGKKDVLADNLARYESAALFLLKTCGGESGLINQEYFVGHLGTKKGIGTSIGQGYWDLLSTPNYSLYSNIYFYKAIDSLLYLEKMAEANGIDTAEPVQVLNAEGTGYDTFDYSIEDLQTLLAKIREKVQEPVNTEQKTGFWDEHKGRFIEGFNYNGEVVDYGFIMFNLEAIDAGLATEQQAEKIMEWVSGDRIVQEDTQAGTQRYAAGKVGSAVEEDGSLNSTGEYGIYDFEFAPRSTTVKNTEQYYWRWGGNNLFGNQVQDGGAIMYVSYYDLMSRIQTRGADDAFARLKEIQKWYNKVEAVAKEQGIDNGIPSSQFYRAYYEKIGVGMQGGGTAGGIGLDEEFLESAILYSVVPFGFFGLGSTSEGVLTVSPELPDALDWWKMENLAYQGIVYDLAVGKGFAEIDYVRGDTTGKKVTFVLPYKDGMQVYIDGKVVASGDYSVQEGSVSITTEFRKLKIEVR